MHLPFDSLLDDVMNAEAGGRESISCILGMKKLKLIEAVAF